jgi:hypothetical protein
MQMNSQGIAWHACLIYLHRKFYKWPWLLEIYNPNLKIYKWKNVPENVYNPTIIICCSFFLALLIKTNPMSVLISWHKASVVPVSSAHWKNMFSYLNCLWNVCLFLFRFRYVWPSNKKITFNTVWWFVFVMIWVVTITAGSSTTFSLRTHPTSTGIWKNIC